MTFLFRKTLPRSALHSTCHTISLTIFCQQRKPKLFLTCLKMVPTKTAMPVALSRRPNLRSGVKDSILTRGAEDGASMTPGADDDIPGMFLCCLVLQGRPICGITACHWDRQGHVSSLWLSTSRLSRRLWGHLGELDNGMSEKCQHFPWSVC